MKKVILNVPEDMAQELGNKLSELIKEFDIQEDNERYGSSEEQRTCIRNIYLLYSIQLHGSYFRPVLRLPD